MTNTLLPVAGTVPNTGRPIRTARTNRAQRNCPRRLYGLRVNYRNKCRQRRRTLIAPADKLQPGNRFRVGYQPGVAYRALTSYEPILQAVDDG
ncbi:hypothetical protein [Spirosoma fluminis]